MNPTTPLSFRKSSYSQTSNCVEVAKNGAAYVRDSKDNKSPILSFSADSWTSFINAVPTSPRDV